MLHSYIPEIEVSHQVGRTLHEINDDVLRKLVVAEVEAELAAIKQAELGDFAGRAAQAVLFTRWDASPTQVAAAFDLFMAEPFGSQQLIEQIDPHAASVAAAYWLLCAAEIASEVSGYNVNDVIMEADNIEAIPAETPRVVLGYLDKGEDPYDVIGELIRSAVQVAGGVAKASALLSELSEENVEEVDREVKLSVLDPKRPALDLLEDLLTGIHAAFLLWDEYSDDEDIPNEDAPDEEWEALAMRKRDSFASELRDRAEENRHLIGLTAS